MNILALDCATKTGWACLRDGHIESGMQDFTKRRGESMGMNNGVMFYRFRGWLNNTFKDSGLDIIVYEQAHHRGGAATEICVNLTGRAQEFAAEIGAEYMAVHTASIKKFITGHGKADKELIKDWFVRKIGRPPVDDNESDAMALLYFVMNDLGIEQPKTKKDVVL